MHILILVGPALASQGLDYFLDHQAWEPNLGVTLDGLKAVLEVYSEQSDTPGLPANPEKYLDLSYLKTALKELR